VPDQDERNREVPLQWRDYVALSIAALQTTLLPFVILILVLIVLWIVLAR
jgi:hypothetical protein